MFLLGIFAYSAQQCCVMSEPNSFHTLHIPYPILFNVFCQMFYLVGLGLGDPKDVTVKGLEIIRRCSRVYLEAYTSILVCGQQQMLEDFYGRELIIADRELVENSADDILLNADTTDVALLVVGDPFGATTHTDLILRARNHQIPYQVVHNASILTAVGCCGLQLYNYGQTVSIPLWTDSWQPDSFYDKIRVNLKNGMHTLCLLDIKIKEPTLESLMKKTRDYMQPTFMTCAQAAYQLLAIVEKKRQETIDLGFNEHSKIVTIARVGHDSQNIAVCALKDVAKLSLGGPLHSLVIPATTLHPMEEDYLQQFKEPNI